MNQTMLRTLMAAGAVAFAGTALASEDVTKCGPKQLKALFGIAISIPIKEAARACGAADTAATAADEVNDDKMIAAAEKFNKLVTDTIEDFGDDDCFLEDSPGGLIDPADVVSTAEGAATDLCTLSP